MSQGGAINRILELEAGENIFTDPQEAVEIFKRHYGHAGKRFVKIIQSIGVDEVKEIQSQLQKELYQDGKMQKQSISLSIILTADRIATDHLFRDGAYITIDEAKELLVDKNELSENERCYQYLLDKIGMNSQRFDADTKVEKWGILEPEHAVIYVQAFKELCKDGGYSDKSFLSWASRKGVIQAQDGRFTKLKKINGKPVRCIFLRLNEFIDDEGFEPAEVVEEYEQEELPFH